MDSDQAALAFDVRGIRLIGHELDQRWPWLILDGIRIATGTHWNKQIEYRWEINCIAYLWQQQSSIPSFYGVKDNEEEIIWN